MLSRCAPASSNSPMGEQCFWMRWGKSPWQPRSNFCESWKAASFFALVAANLLKLMSGSSPLQTGCWQRKWKKDVFAKISSIDSTSFMSQSRRFAPGLRVASVGFVEVDPEATAPDAADALPFDYVWLTPVVDLDDPCDKYREMLERLRERR